MFRTNRRPVRPGVRLTGWLLIVAVPVLVLGGLEAVVRLLDLSPADSPAPSAPAWLDRNILVKESEWMELLSDSPRDFSNYYLTYRWDRYLFYALRPDLQIPMTDITAPAPIRERTGWIFRTNERGFNSRLVPYEKPEGVFRIVTLGDSSTFGWGVDSESIYPHRLEGILRARHPGLRIEVVNLGVCGYSSLQGLVLMRTEALRYTPDVVTLSYGSNDFSLVLEPFDEILERNEGWSGAMRALLMESRAYRLYASALSGAARGNPGAGRVLNVGPEKGRDNMIAMVDLARSRGVDPIFVTNCVPGEMEAPIVEAARESGVPVLRTGELLPRAAERIDLEPGLAELVSGYRDLYGPALMDRFPWLAVYLTDACHPNAAGHALIATSLAPVVEETPAFSRFLSRVRP